MENAKMAGFLFEPMPTVRHTKKKWQIFFLCIFFRTKCVEDVRIRVAAVEIAEVEAVSVVQTVAIAAATHPAVDIIVRQTAASTIGTVEVIAITGTVADRAEAGLDSSTGHHPIDFRAKVTIGLTIGYVSHPLFFYMYLQIQFIHFVSNLQNDSRNRDDSPSRKRARHDVSQFAYSILCVIKKKLINLGWISIFVWSLIHNYYYQKYCKQLNFQHDIFSSQTKKNHIQLPSDWPTCELGVEI